MDHAEFLKEQEHFESVRKIVDEQLVKVKKTNPWAGTTDYRVAEQMSKMYAREEEALKKAQDAPYFGRIDFEADPNMDTEDMGNVFYIGKSTVMDDDYTIIVTDWRAPISNLYYEGDIGRASYIAPAGTITGDLTLKRQYQIKDKKFVSYADVTIATNDELLQNSLSDSSDSRLRNIVATIQAEQNTVIRREIKKDLIVQGVAGSGKTTVALHRIAYLLYAYQKKLSPDKILILAPNRFFLDYISDTLPDLGVQDIIQETYEDFAQEFIGTKYGIVSQNESLRNKLMNKELLNFRCSLKFRDIVAKYIQDMEENLFNNLSDLTYNGERIIKATVIREVLERNKDSLSISERLGRLKEYLIAAVNGILDENNTGIYRSGVKLSIDTFFSFQKEYKKVITSYIKSIQLKDVYSHYKALIMRSDLFDGVISSKDYKLLKDDVLNSIKKKMINYEDLPTLLYMYYKIFGISKEKQLQYIVIDEAQDLGEFHMAVLKELFKDAKFTILGDIAQGIYARGIENWSEVNREVFGEDAEVINLVQSYRTSIEVMNEANKVAEKMQPVLSIKLATPVLRHSDKVLYHDNMSMESLASRIQELVKEDRKNIAVITKTNEKALEVYQNLSKFLEDVHLLTDSTTAFLPGISVLSSYLSKGLEFDSVILYDAEAYGEDILDGKLLYVAMTRAMHTLDICMNGPCVWLK